MKCIFFPVRIIPFSQKCSCTYSKIHDLITTPQQRFKLRRVRIFFSILHSCAVGNAIANRGNPDLIFLAKKDSRRKETDKEKNSFDVFQRFYFMEFTIAITKVKYTLSCINCEYLVTYWIFIISFSTIANT